jgi:hypothetical protein
MKTWLFCLQTESELEVSRLIDDLGLQDRQQYVCAHVICKATLMFACCQHVYISQIELMDSIFVSA